MANQDEIYRKKICDVCNAVTYEKYTGENVLDGGYTRLRQFEDNGYEIVTVPGKDKLNLMCCPNCQRLLREAMLNTMNKINPSETNAERM